MAEYWRITAVLSIALALSSLSSCAVMNIGRRATESFLGEEDADLVRDSLPAYVKAAEILASTFPDSASVALSAAGLELLYASSFLAPAASRLPNSAHAERRVLTARAGAMYMRGAGRAWSVLGRRVPGIADSLRRGEEDGLRRLRKRDVSAMYYAAGGSIGAYSLDPFDAMRARDLRPALRLARRALELDPDWDSGSLHSLMMQIAPSLPPDLGGGYEAAEKSYAAALAASGGRQIGLYVAYARSVCVPRGDREGFVAAVSAALSVDPSIDPEARLANTLARLDAQRLMEEIDDLFPGF